MFAASTWGLLLTANFHTKWQDFSPEPKQATLNFRKVPLFEGIFFSFYLHCPCVNLLSRDFFLLGCPKQCDSVPSSTEIAVWVFLWAAAPWHGKFVWLHKPPEMLSAGVRKPERAISGWVKACRKTPLPDYFYEMNERSSLLPYPGWKITHTVSNSLSWFYWTQLLAFNYWKTLGDAWIYQFELPFVIWINM